MSRLKIEHGASKVRWTLLKTNIEELLANDIDLMCQWSENDRKYMVNELLRFAIAQAEDFQKYKAEHSAPPPEINTNPQSLSPAAKPGPASAGKPDLASKSAAERE